MFVIKKLKYIPRKKLYLRVFSSHEARIEMTIGLRLDGHLQKIPAMDRVPLLWAWAWVRVITHKIRWIWVRVRALYYPFPEPAYTYLYNIINILFIFGVQLFNLFSYLSINLNLKTNTVIVSSLPS